MIGRAVVRHALLLLFVFLALAPATALAFNPPDPNSPGHHFGEYLHNPHMQSTPSGPGAGNGGTGGTGRSGIQDSFAGPVNSANTTVLPTVNFQPASFTMPTLSAAHSVGKDVWWVAVLLAAVIAANVVLGVLWLARGVNALFKRSLRLVPSTA